MILEKVKSLFRTLRPKNYIFFYILLYSIAPLVSIVTSRFLKTYFYMAVVVVTVIYIFYMCRLKDIKRFAFLLIPFVFYQIGLIILEDRSDFLLTGYQALLFMLPLCIGYFIMINKTKVAENAFVIVFAYSITLITTVVGCIRNPEAARQLATEAAVSTPEIMAYYWQNIGGYSFVYSCTLLYPLVILAYKTKRIPLPVALAFAAAEFALAIYTEYTLSFMLMLTTSLLFFVKKDISPKKFFMLLIIGGLSVVLFSGTVVAVLQFIGKLVGNDLMTQKMIAIFIGEDVVDGDNRIELYKLSFSTFLSNPLFGTLFGGKGKIGGHSFILDTLAGYGLLGAGMMFWMYRSVYRIFCKPFKNEITYSFVVWTFTQTLILSGINTGMWLGNLCIFAPCLLCWIYKRNQPVNNAVVKGRLFRPLLPPQDQENR